MTASGSKPRNPASPKIAFRRSPIPKPPKNFRAVRSTPLYTVSPAAFTSIVAPLQNRYKPIRVGIPFLKSPVVKPPIFKASGKNVFTVHPSSSGITIAPAGNFFIVPSILTLPIITCTLHTNPTMFFVSEPVLTYYKANLMPTFPFHAKFFFFSIFRIHFYVFCTNINLCFNALSQLILFTLSLLHSIFFLFHAC